MLMPTPARACKFGRGVRRGLLQRRLALDARQGAGGAGDLRFALKHGGRFAGEMGGEGNLATLREALARSWSSAATARRPMPPMVSDVEEFAASMSSAGFSDIDARLIERPTPLPSWRRRLGHDLPRRLARPRRWCPTSATRRGVGRGAVAARFGSRRSCRRLCPPALHMRKPLD